MFVPFGLPDHTDSDWQTHFTVHSVWAWAVKTKHHLELPICHVQQTVGLIERHNGLLKDAVLNLQNGQWSP